MNGRFNLDSLPNGVIISRYFDYESDEPGNCDLNVMTAKKDLAKQLKVEAKKGRFRVYRGETGDDDVAAVIGFAWQRVWNGTQSDEPKCAFAVDYEPSEIESGRTARTVYIALS